jgi:hypothetical protein
VRSMRKHGTELMYQKAKCRCRECMDAHALFRREERALCKERDPWFRRVKSRGSSADKSTRPIIGRSMVQSHPSGPMGA